VLLILQWRVVGLKNREEEGIWDLSWVGELTVDSAMMTDRRVMRLLTSLKQQRDCNFNAFRSS
jgi:hypothetical protein